MCFNYNKLFHQQLKDFGRGIKEHNLLEACMFIRDFQMILTNIAQDTLEMSHRRLTGCVRRLGRQSEI